MKKHLITLIAVGALISATQAVISAPPGTLVVHEWGTFTSLQGSDGEIVQGMHHEDEPLPNFVHGRDPKHESGLEHCCAPKCTELCPGKSGFPFPVTQKMETPVMYFYSPETQKVSVHVSFPMGVISQFYPNPISVQPLVGELRSLSGSSVDFRINLEKTPLNLPTVDPRNIYAPAREVNSDFIKNGDESEKFIFYRGLGDFDTHFHALSKEGSLTIQNRGQDPYPAVFLIESTETHGYVKLLGAVASNSSIQVSQTDLADMKAKSLPTEQYLAEATQSLVTELKNTGLFEDESQAMAKTWKTSYFRTPGIRLLYILPAKETDQILPLTVHPQPQALVRTMVGRVEILLDTEEANLLAELRSQKELFRPHSLGRFAESKLRRVKQLTSNAEELKLIDSLINSLQ
jgi:hypothetical protein